MQDGDGADVPFAAGDFLFRGDVPNANAVEAVAGRDFRRAAEGQREDAPFVEREVGDFRTVGDVPNFDERTVSGGGDLRTVRAEGDGANASGSVRLKFAGDFAVFRRPNANDAVATADRLEGTVGRETNRGRAFAGRAPNG